MGVEMIKQYIETYKMGSHCASTSLMNIAAYHGLNYSEDICFGLGAGLGFSIYKIEKMSKICFSGRAREIERAFFRFLGINVRHKYCMSNEDAWIDLNRIINVEHRPVLIKLDMSTLMYLKEYFKLTEKLDLSEHMAVIIGIKGNSVIISEYFQKEPFVITKEELFLSMNQKFESKSLYNQYYDIDSFAPPKEFQASLMHAIYVNSHQMLYGFGANLGIPGLRKFVNDILLWNKCMSFKEARENLHIAYVSFEKIGTGGGNFRRMYSRFLKKSADILDIDQLNVIADHYSELAILWKKLAVELDRYSGFDDFSEVEEHKLHDILVNILNLELNAVTLLNATIINEINKSRR